MKLILITVACLIALAFGQNTTTEQTTTTTTTASSSTPLSCSQQLEAWQICELKDMPRSAEGKLMKQKIDGIYDKCSGTMPKNCTTFWRTADECFHRELDNVDSDSQLKEAKRQTLQIIDQCYQRTPNDPFADLFEELYPEMQLFDDGGLKPQQQLGSGGRKFLPPPQCAPTIENLQCVSAEMTNLAKDSEARKASASLRRQKQSCDDKLTSECVPQSPPLWMCVDRAMKQITRQTEEAMQKCMQQKGFAILLRQSPALPPLVPGMPILGQPTSGVGQQAMVNGMPVANGPMTIGMQGQPQQPRFFDWYQ